MKNCPCLFPSSNVLGFVSAQLKSEGQDSPSAEVVGVSYDFYYGGLHRHKSNIWCSQLFLMTREYTTLMKNTQF